MRVISIMKEKNKIMIVLMLLIFAVFFFVIKDKKSLPIVVEYKNREIIPWGIESMNIQEIHKSGFTGKGIKVAFLDSGINYHSDFKKKHIKKGYNATNPSIIPNDDNGHGTLIAGVVAASKNDFGFLGVAPDIDVYPVKVLDEFGLGDIDVVIDGIEWCIKNKVDIINMSFAISKDSKKLKEAINKALDSGIIIVASAKNSYGGEVGYPASYEGVISVTAVDSKLKAGDTTPRGKIDFSAPGVDIISTTFDGSYDYYSGTSIATPFISGVIALLLQKNTSLNYSEIYDTLKEYSKDLGKKGKDDVYGEGIVILP